MLASWRKIATSHFLPWALRVPCSLFGCPSCICASLRDMIHLDPVPQIWGVTGNLGGGKTLSAVSLAVEAIRNGLFVCSNVTLNLDALSHDYGDWVRSLYLHFDFDDPDFDAAKLPCGSPRGTKGGKRVLVVLDEVAEWIDQYSSMQDPRIKDFFSWLRHSSKRSQDVVLVVQRLDYLNKSLRILVSKWVIVDDLRVYRLPILKLPCSVLGLGGHCMQRVFDRNKRLVQGPCIVSKRRFGRYYSTSQCLNSAIGDGSYQYSRPRLYYGWGYYAFIAALFFFGALLLVVFCPPPRHLSAPEIYEAVYGNK